MMNMEDTVGAGFPQSQGDSTIGVRPLTLGERYVGLTFNPSGDKSVIVVKQAYANIIDLLNALSDGTDERARFVEGAITQAITAQMWAVKALTWKD